jgi:hypothetical protein
MESFWGRSDPKLLICDDEYVLIGSANINERYGPSRCLLEMPPSAPIRRSMSGARDTEVAVGAVEVQHCKRAGACLPQGQVCALRLTVWRKAGSP